MALRIPTPPTSAEWHPVEEQHGGASSPIIPQFNTLLLHIMKGQFFGPAKRSFRFHARLGKHEERSTLILSQPPGKDFTIDSVLRFPYTPGSQELAITARLEARHDKYLGSVFLDLSGVSPERNSLKAQIPLKERDGTALGVFDIEVQLIYDEEEFAEATDGLSPRSPFNFTHPMTPAGLARRFGLALSPAQSTTLSPKVGDRSPIEVPFRGLNVTVTIGSKWNSVANKKVMSTVTVGNTPMRSKEMIQVTPDGDFEMNLLFRHRFDGERLILVSIVSEHGEPVGDAVVDAIMMIEMGIVTCVQNLQFYTRLGRTAGCARVVFDFSYADPGTPRTFKAALPSALNNNEASPASTAGANGEQITLQPRTCLAAPATVLPRGGSAVSSIEKGPVDVPKKQELTPQYEIDETTAPGPTFREDASPVPSSQMTDGAWNETNDGPTTPSGAVSRSASRKSHHRRSKSPSRSPKGTTPQPLIDVPELLPPKRRMEGLLCSVSRVYDYQPGTTSCVLSTILDDQEATSESISCTFQDTAVRRVFVLPYDGQEELLVRCSFLDRGLIGEGSVPLQGEKAESGLAEVQLLDRQTGQYHGRVELWVQLTPSLFGLAPGIIGFAESPEYRDLMLPPAHMAALALAETESVKGRRRSTTATATKTRSGRLILPKKEGGPASPRCLGSPTGVRPKESHFIALLDPPRHGGEDEETWEPSKHNASSIFFKIHGFRNLPDVYRCESMKIVIVARLGNVSSVSRPFRFNHLDPDLENCVFCLPRSNGDRYLQIDLLEVTLVKSPLKLGHFVWDAMCADRLDGVDHGYTRMEGGPAYCLHTAMLSSEDAPDATFFGIEDPVPFNLPNLECLLSSNGSSSSIPMEFGDDGAASMTSAVASLVLVAKVVHNLRTPFPFTHVEICMEVEFGGYTQRSAPVLSNKFYRVPLNARFRLPLVSLHNMPPLRLRLFASTPVTEPRLIAHGCCDLTSRSAGLEADAQHMTIQMEYENLESSDQPALLEVSVKRSKRVVRVPEVEKLGNRTIVSGGGVPISAF